VTGGCKQPPVFLIDKTFRSRTRRRPSDFASVLVVEAASLARPMVSGENSEGMSFAISTLYRVASDNEDLAL
jgi:hypothetical protein